MKSLALVFTLLLSWSLAPVQAQEELSKDERREWRSRAKEYKRNPAALKALFEDHEAYRDRALAAESDKNQLQSTLDAKDRQMAAMEEQIANLNQQLIAAQQAPPPPPPNQPDILPSDRVLDGIVFRVQLGAFQQNRLDEGLDTSNNLALEEADNLQKVVVGQFRNYDNAKVLRDRLRRMGASDAFIVAYRNGQRISVQDALKG